MSAPPKFLWHSWLHRFRRTRHHAGTRFAFWRSRWKGWSTDTVPRRFVPFRLIGSVRWSGMTATTQRPYSVLITDDDRQQRETLRDIVEPEGYRALLASSGEEALEIVRHEPVHVVLLDMHMPRLTGLETVQLVHQQVSVTLPCILVTPDATETLLRQAL